jgi:photosystem II stability/assembly factor-like uncharacterized protein
MNSRLLLACTLLIATPLRLSSQLVPQTSNTDAELRGLSVVSPRIVWASGTKGRVVHTTDGGRTWRVDTIAQAATLDLRDIAALSDKTAWAMSSGDADKGQARIFKTTDGGAHWSLVYSDTTKGVFLDALGFWDTRHGIAMSDPIGGKLFLVTTTDGGATWTRVPPDRLPPVLAGEAAFAASGTCLAVQGASHVWIATGGGATARVFHSADRGRTWSVAQTPVRAGSASSGNFSVAFRDAMHGTVVGGDYQQAHGASPNVALTSDGGRTWRLAHGPLPQGYLSAVSYVPGAASTLVATGLVGTARSTDGGESWTMVDSVGYNSVGFASKTAGWLVGPRGRIAKWSAVQKN